MQEIADWLKKLGLGQYAQRFAENDNPSETFNFGRSVPSTTPYARLNTFLALVTADDGRVLFAHLGDNPVLNGGSRRFCYSRARGDV